MSESDELERQRSESIASLLVSIRGGREKGSASRLRPMAYTRPTFIYHPNGHYLMVSHLVGYWEWQVSRTGHRNFAGFKWLARGFARTKRDAMRLGKLVLESIASAAKVPT